MAESRPARKSPAQVGELVPNFIPESGMYSIIGKKGAEVPAELQGTFTTVALANRAVRLHFSKKAK